MRREPPIPLNPFATIRKYVSCTVHKNIIDEKSNPVDISNVLFLPIRSDMTPPGNKDTADPIKCEEMIVPKKVVENPSSKMYKLKMTVNILVPTVITQ
jgi:hypothetical protein